MGRQVRDPVTEPGIVGGAVSIVIPSAEEVDEELPAMSVAIAVIDREPSDSDAAVQLNAPDPLARHVAPDIDESADS